MQRNSTAEVRQQFLDFFASKGHEVVPSSSLIPGNDKTLLFTNAGMVQFKDIFTGDETRAYTRAVTSQRCVRAGGKHNDLENVGYTARHHTFFEMLGNFSFGDYFKKEAIHNAWEFLTEVIKLPKEKLWVTVYAEDDEAANIWINEIGFPEARISRIGDKPGKRYESDNFWAMGDTGPCGPCSEIFYDHGEEIWGGPPGTPEEDGDRFIEIWNLVFMQFERFPDGTMKPLPKPSIDTGMGLERLCAILQNGHSNYDIDLFQYLIKKIAAMANVTDLENASLKVIADHIRSCAFLILDGVVPSNEGRGYVLRRIIRRAARHGHKLGLEGAFFYKLVQPLVDQMGAAYPALAEAQTSIESTLKKEEKRFGETLDKGMKLLDEAIAELRDDVLPGEVMFKLYDTFGFPADLTADIVRERGLKDDWAGFEAAMQKQVEASQAAGKFGADYTSKLDVEGATIFTGYDGVDSEQCEVVSVFVEGDAVEKIAAGQSAQVVLNTTPFYAESGGQIGDTGRLTSASASFVVTDTQKQSDVFIHYGTLSEGTLSVGDHVAAHVDAARRQSIVLNHSGTHLMHQAMRDVLGKHVEQKGSLVTDERLRFDFSQPEPVSAAQIAEIEHLVNEEIRSNVTTEIEVTSMDRALEKGAMALFGEKYGDDVRVVSMGPSSELCGGTHVSRTGEIGIFKIVSESGVAAGVRRVEAMTGEGALSWMDEREAELASIAKLVKSSVSDAPGKVKQLVDKNRQLEKELEQLKAKLAAQAGNNLLSQAVDVGGIQVLAANLEGADPKSLRDTADQLKNKLGKAAVVVATVKGDKVSLVASVTKAESAIIKAGELLGFVAGQIDGKGGGRPDMAQGGGNNPAALPAALDSVVNWVKERV
ncbi:MAG: alanine--tRNA ligase [Proteobacteria bacterium]|nr:MAG: alanine--tRNA ligase [Pseudomonadota bacterium]